MFVFAALTLAIWNPRQYGHIRDIFVFRIWDAQFEFCDLKLWKLAVLHILGAPHRWPWSSNMLISDASKINSMITVSEMIWNMCISDEAESRMKHTAALQHYVRFPKFHRVFLGRDPGTLKSDIVSKKHPQLSCSDLRLSNWKFEDWNYGNRPYATASNSKYSEICYWGYNTTIDLIKRYNGWL